MPLRRSLGVQDLDIPYTRLPPDRSSQYGSPVASSAGGLGPVQPRCWSRLPESEGWRDKPTVIGGDGTGQGGNGLFLQCHALRSKEWGSLLDTDRRPG